MAGWRKGKFVPKNPHKYIGPDIDKITYRSSWEKQMMEFMDNNEYVLAWASEPIAISYMKPSSDKKGNPIVKQAKYYPDFYIEYVDADKNFHKELIEIKPEKQTKSSRARKPTVKLTENYVFAVNTAKWTAAKEWCKQYDIEFKIYTEKSIYG